MLSSLLILFCILRKRCAFFSALVQSDLTQLPSFSLSPVFDIACVYSKRLLRVERLPISRSCSRTAPQMPGNTLNLMKNLRETVVYTVHQSHFYTDEDRVG